MQPSVPVHTFLLLAVLFLLSGSPATAQARGSGWRVSAGGGVGVNLHRGDDGDTESAAGVARVSVDRALGPGLRLGLEWLGSWMEGSFLGESRHHVGLVASLHRWEAPVIARFGVGLGTATVVEIDGPPEDGPGDIDVGVGGMAGVGGIAGAEVHVPLARWMRLVPALDVMVQRSAGYGFVTGMLTVRLLLGPPGG